MKSTISTRIVCVFFCVAAAFGQQPPPSTPPDQQPPPTVPGTPATPKPTVQLPPTVPKPTPTPKQERDTGGDAFSIEAAFWQTHEAPKMYGGAKDVTGLPGDFFFNGAKKYSLEGVATIPTTHEDSLEITYFRNQGTGDQVIPKLSNYFGNNFAAQDQIFSSYTLQTAKVSWNYLTYPYPSNGAKFRLKTLWEVQFAHITSTFSAPADLNAVTTFGAKNVILPTFGLGIEYHPVKKVRIEVKGSGFGIPHHADIWDAQAFLVWRVAKAEVFLGGQAYHYKTSPQGDHYYSQTLAGPLVGVRYLFK